MRLKIEQRQKALMQVYREAFGEPDVLAVPESLNGRPSGAEIRIDEKLLTQMREAANGEKFSALFDRGEYSNVGDGTPSAGDFALIGYLRFWLWKDGGAAAIDAYFRRSALMRDKWDERRGNTTYGWWSIAKATGGDFDYYGRDRRPQTRSSNGASAPPQIITANRASTTPVQDGFAAFDATVAQEHREQAPPLPIDVFGEQWAQWLEGTAKAKAAPVDFTAMPLLTAAASLIGNARRVAPYPSWVEATILWIARVGEPSTNKTPGAQPIYDIMGILQWEQKEGYAELVRKWQEDKIKAKAALNAYNSDIAEAMRKQAARVKQVSLPKTAIEPPRPVEPSLMTVDATMESLGPLFAVQPKGFLERREELAGWLTGFDKYHGRSGSERSFWIEAYNGHYYNIRRAKFEGGSLDIKYLSISLEGSMQPDRLGTLMLEGEDDGLTARFLFSWPDGVEFEQPRGQPDQAIALNALRRLRNLQMIGSDGNKTFKTILFNTAATKLFVQWRKTRYKLGETELSGKPLSWHGKLPGVVLRVSLVLTYLRWCIGTKSATEPCDIPATCVRDAIRLVEEYFMPMANRVFGDAKLASPVRHAKRVARMIQTRKLGAESSTGLYIINVRDIYRRTVMEPEQAQQAVDELVEAGWLRRTNYAGMGRTRSDYEVNPQLFTTAGTKRNKQRY